MTSMRIDSGASVKLWAKRLDKLIKEIESDGKTVAAERGAIYIDSDEDWDKVRTR